MYIVLYRNNMKMDEIWYSRNNLERLKAMYILIRLDWRYGTNLYYEVVAIK